MPNEVFTIGNWSGYTSWTLCEAAAPTAVECRWIEDSVRAYLDDWSAKFRVVVEAPYPPKTYIRGQVEPFWE